MGGSSGGGGGSQSTQTIQKSDPWESQQPYLLRGFQEAQKLFLDQAPPEMYPGTMTLPYSPETETALQLTTTRALTGSPISNAYKNQLTDTLGGSYYPGFDMYYSDPTQSPGFNNAVDSAARKIIPQVDSAFNRAGRTGSGLADVAKTQAVSDSYADLWQRDRELQAGNYNQERENQLRGMLFAPQAIQQEYDDFGRLAAVGEMRDSLEQRSLDEQVGRHDYSSGIRQEQLMNFLNAIQGNYGSSSTGSASQTGGGSSGGKNPLSGAIGGAAAGTAVMPGWGTLIGGGLGLLSGFI